MAQPNSAVIDLLERFRSASRADPHARQAALLDLLEIWLEGHLRERHWHARLRYAQRAYRTSEIVTGVGSAAAVTTLPVWSSGLGRVAWLTIAILLAVVTVVRTVFRFPATVEELSARCAGWRTHVSDLRDVADSLRGGQEFPEGLWDAYNVIRRRHRELVNSETLPEDTRHLRPVAEDPVGMEIESRVQRARDRLDPSRTGLSNHTQG